MNHYLVISHNLLTSATEVVSVVAAAGPDAAMAMVKAAQKYPPFEDEQWTVYDLAVVQQTGEWYYHPGGAPGAVLEWKGRDA